MTRLLAKIILVFLCSSYTYYSQNIEFQIMGNRLFTTKQYSDWLGKIRVRNNEELRDSIIARLSRHLTANGYFNFKIDSFSVKKDSSAIKIILVLKEGVPTTINKIIFDGLNRNDSEFVLQNFSYLTGKVFSKYELESAINQTLRKFENNGYPFTEIKIQSMLFTGGNSPHPTVNIYLKLNKGEPAKIDRIEVEGNSGTKSYVISREFRFNAGEEYSEKKIEQGVAALQKLDYFQEVAKPQYYVDQGGNGILRVRVKEKSTNNFDGIVGYVPSQNKKTNGYFTGYLNISLRNLFGTGRAFAFRWMQENKYSQELELKYLEPWVFNFPINILARLYQRKQDTTYVKRTLNFELTYLASENFSASILAGSESTTPTLNKSLNLSVFNSSSFSSGVIFQYDSRDNIFAPASGAIFNSAYKFTQKKIYGPKELLTPGTKTKTFNQKLELNFAFYLQLFNRNVLAFNLSGRELRGSQLDISDLYRIGGANSVRGYREKQFAGNRTAWSNFEYRYLLARNSFAFLFLDAGYFLKSEGVIGSPNKQSEFLRSYGLGFSLATGLGILKVSYAIAKGSALTEGFIHFGLHNRF